MGENRFGKVNGRQRYRCKACRKTFTDTTNTILYRTRKGNECITFVECMFKGYSLRKSAEIVGVLGLHYSTGDISYFRLLNKWILNELTVLLKLTRLISYTLKKDDVISRNENLVSEVENPSIVE